MNNDLIHRMQREILGIQDDPNDPLHRLIETLKVSLKEYPAIKEQFFSANPETKKMAIQATQWITEVFEKEFRTASRNTGQTGEHLFALLYQSDKLTAEECRAFLQARATILQNRKALSEEKLIPKKVKQAPKRLRI